MFTIYTLFAVAKHHEMLSTEEYVHLLQFPILEREAAAAGVALPPFIPLDTYQLCKVSGLQRRLNLDNLKQDTLIRHYGVSQTVAHRPIPYVLNSMRACTHCYQTCRALDDAQALATCLPWLLQDATGRVTNDLQGLVKAALDIVYPSGTIVLGLMIYES
eukprot:scaffold317878_cov19-Tisochrysis_lutea.AAC.1